MTDKYAAFRDLLGRVNDEDTDDCFEAYLKWRKTFDIDSHKALLAERDALLEALLKMSNAYAFIKPPGYPKSDAEKQADAAIAKATT